MGNYWRKTKLPKFGHVESDQKFDVVVIGGGITGLTTAYLLKKLGKKVCVVERDRIGVADTGNTTAHLTYVTDPRLSTIAKDFGKEQARLTWLAGAAAIDTIEQIVRTLEIDCGFQRVPGYLHSPLNGKEDERKQLRDEAELARELNFDAVFVEGVPVLDKPGIRFSNQAKFHPYQYLAGLAEAIDGGACKIFEKSEAESVDEEPYAVKVNGKRIRCKYVVIATHVPLMGKTGMVSATLFQSKLYAYSSYVIGAQIPRGRLPEASFWDTAEPYDYLRIDRFPKFDYAIFGGEDHKTGQKSDTEACYARLEKRLKRIVPEAKVVDRWSGQVIETPDGLPYIGETAERQFVSTGFAGNGMTFGTLAAMMACDAYLKRKNPWQELFDVNRKKIRGAAWEYIKENVSYPYYLVKDWITPAEAKSTRAVGRGEGKIIKLGGERVACSRDEHGKVHTVSAVCTHMGCLVHWNGSEKSWDCPCHGSRFSADGEVMAGPAETPLPKVDPTATAANGKKPSGQKQTPARRR